VGKAILISNGAQCRLAQRLAAAWRAPWSAPHAAGRRCRVFAACPGSFAGCTLLQMQWMGLEAPPSRAQRYRNVKARVLA